MPEIDKRGFVRRVPRTSRRACRRRDDGQRLRVPGKAARARRPATVTVRDHRAASARCIG
jgi:hypothetical protein